MIYLAEKMKLDLKELKAGINDKAKFYGVEDFDEREKLVLFVLASVRDLNDMDLNLYREGSYYKISYRDNYEQLTDDEDLFVNIFKFFDQNNLKYFV